jgi:hypothetical protein
MMRSAVCVAACSKLTFQQPMSAIGNSRRALRAWKTKSTARFSIIFVYCVMSDHRSLPFLAVQTL